jgi:hypothetical protein
METKSSPVLRLLGTVLGGTLLVSLIIVLVGLVFRWDTALQFSNGFFVAGVIVILLGTFSVTGGFQQRASFPLAYAETTSDASIAERGQRMMADINQRYGTLVLMIGTGILLIAVSVVITRLF